MSAQELSLTPFSCKASRSFLDVGSGKGDVDGNISRGDLESALETIRFGSHQDELFDTASGTGGRDDHVSNEDLAAAATDTGLTDAQRAAAAQLLAEREAADEA